MRAFLAACFRSPVRCVARVVLCLALATPLSPLRTVHADLACTLYTSPTGLADNAGTLGSPTTLQQAERLTVPGSVVCIGTGTYTLTPNSEPSGLDINRSGSANSPVTYTSYNGTVLLTYYYASSGAAIKVDAGTNWVTINGITVDGGNLDTTDILSVGTPGTPNTHLTVTNNTIQNAGVEGVGTVYADYTTVDHNVLSHNGYWNSGACGDTCEGSAISLNQSLAADGNAGFHSVVTNNVVAGSTYAGTVLPPTDGNGIIMDLGGATPLVLIANNLVYMNGGRCIRLNSVSNVWVVNNTCYKNALLNTGGGEITLATSTASFIVNNAVSAWNSQPPYSYWESSAITFANNTYYGGSNFGLPGEVTGTQMISADPLLVAPPAVDPTAGGQYAAALDPALIGTRFQLQGTSTLIGAGIDPVSLTGDPTLQAQLTQYLSHDLVGTARSGWDIGAYEYVRPTVATATPAPRPTVATPTPVPRPTVATATPVPRPTVATATPVPRRKVASTTPVTRLKVASAGLKPTPNHGGPNVCTVSIGAHVKPGVKRGPWVRVVVQTGACAGGGGWLLSAALVKS